MTSSEGFPDFLCSVARAGFTALAPLSLVLFVHQRALIPLYGSYPVSYSFDAVVVVSLAASALLPFGRKKGSRWLAIALVSSVAPNVSYWVAVWMARLRQPILGPALTHALVIAPLIFLFAGPNIWSRIDHLKKVSESQIYLGLAGVAFSIYVSCLDLSYNPTKPKKKVKTQAEHILKPWLSPVRVKAALLIVFSAFWYIASPILANPVLPHPLDAAFTHPTGKFQILDAVESVTGLIVVGDILPHLEAENEDPLSSARYLRASHSLLGGVWTRDKARAIDNKSFLRDSFGTKLGDTVYSTFVLQEAVRLVNSTETGRKGAWKNALTIGLGTGFSTSAFIRHGINTTVVEIDPAVYNAARVWFGLPDPGRDNVFLEDAREFVEKRYQKVQVGIEKHLYDIVVHDCFSGGGVPEHIFTSEFWGMLKVIMDAEGVLVVNFAGVVTSRSSKLILHTLENSFKQCRAFHDWMKPLGDDEYGSEFVNVVFFCTNSEAPMTFREPKESDYLGSQLREYVFKSLEQREVKLDLVRVQDPNDVENYILSDKHNSLRELQREQGLHHWEVMRQVLPDIMWESY
ncbi:hypothetical protein AGABI2DRAFT_188516 [Agaricus bisporus var. bisporus H97]|uniref:hypothetical protein n=1 Tax=Agaricus bisporus var. bisporus (strain H97 / ATCC MYA-4626 / FGSC 10389) TaxID=936046 RepID=UPI00029F654B|nr:hypothetical protein AGABI2DRAFT_188516 [Agaricus bisporus var. bisporus H97]EKV42336.1 hypothetical protein AGABI2DRAFT_188516 [Agaricus bisporus var. bisporus H97]